MTNTTPVATEAPVLAERRGGVLLLTLNRPQKLNAWSAALEERYFDLLDEADTDPAVRAVVVTGAGRGFCSGADLDDLQAVAKIDVRELPPPSRPRSHPLALRKPLIAAINGAAAGLGLVEALYCDVRFATPEAKLTTAFSRRGLIAEYGLAWTLSRLIGPGLAADLLMSGRIVRGEEALRMGLIERLSEPGRIVDDAVAYAHDLATNCSPTSMAIIKAQLAADTHRSFDAAVAAADEEMLASFERADVAEGVNSLVERRAPDFPPLAPRD